MAALAPGDEQPVLTGPDVDEPQTEDPAAAHPAASLRPSPDHDGSATPQATDRPRRVPAAAAASAARQSAARRAVEGSVYGSTTPAVQGCSQRPRHREQSGTRTAPTARCRSEQPTSRHGLRDLGSGHHSLPQCAPMFLEQMARENPATLTHRWAYDKAIGKSTPHCHHSRPPPRRRIPTGQGPWRLRRSPVLG